MSRTVHCIKMGLGVSLIGFGGIILGLPLAVVVAMLMASAIAGSLYYFRETRRLKEPLAFCLCVALPTGISIHLFFGLGMLCMSIGAIQVWDSWQRIKQLKKEISESNQKEK